LQMDNINKGPQVVALGGGNPFGRKKSGKIIADENGNPTGIEIREEPVEKPEVSVKKIWLDDDGNPAGIELE